ncbi:hypothetical protein [Effusibacillus consociatus]|uniref:YtkA-like domain-containing protein n=1 Tax=Effusibacillus consociatus TaxID=1117041 RepID=A0ABV9Q8L9_9BACL
MRQIGTIGLLNKQISRIFRIVCLLLLFTAQLTYAHAGHGDALVIADVKPGSDQRAFAGDQFTMKVSLFDFAAVKAKEQGKTLSSPEVIVTLTNREKTINVKPQPVGEGDYRAEIILPKSGDWKLSVTAQRPEDKETAKFEDQLHVKSEIEKIAPLWVWIAIPTIIVAGILGYFLKRMKRV